MSKSKSSENAFVAEKMKPLWSLVLHKKIMYKIFMACLSNEKEWHPVGPYINYETYNQ